MNRQLARINPHPNRARPFVGELRHALDGAAQVVLGERDRVRMFLWQHALIEPIQQQLLAIKKQYEAALAEHRKEAAEAQREVDGLKAQLKDAEVLDAEIVKPVVTVSWA